MFKLFLPINWCSFSFAYQSRTIGQLVIAKPIERKSILEEAAGISGIHARRQEAETRLNAAENNLKRADELKNNNKNLIV